KWNTQSIDWLPGGKHLVVPSLEGARLMFWAVAVGNGEARRLPLELMTETTVFTGQITVRGGRMAFANVNSKTEIGRLQRTPDGHYHPAPFYSASRSDQEPQISPDGKHIVFSSLRSGNREIWRADADGSNALQLTTAGEMRVGSPRWSPDGQTIVLDGYRNG